MGESVTFSSGWESDVSLDAHVCVELLTSRKMWLFVNQQMAQTARKFLYIHNIFFMNKF
jgi:hypothetical protein